MCKKVFNWKTKVNSLCSRLGLDGMKMQVRICSLLHLYVEWLQLFFAMKGVCWGPDKYQKTDRWTENYLKTNEPLLVPYFVFCALSGFQFNSIWVFDHFVLVLCTGDKWISTLGHLLCCTSFPWGKTSMATHVFSVDTGRQAYMIKI